MHAGEMGAVGQGSEVCTDQPCSWLGCVPMGQGWEGMVSSSSCSAFPPPQPRVTADGLPRGCREDMMNILVLLYCGTRCQGGLAAGAVGTVLLLSCPCPALGAPTSRGCWRGLVSGQRVPSAPGCGTGRCCGLFQELVSHSDWGCYWNLGDSAVALWGGARVPEHWPWVRVS